MLEAIYEAIQYLVEFLVSIGEFVVQTVVGLGELLVNIPAIVVMLTSSIANLPAFVLPYATASISIAVLLLVVGRNNN